MSKMNNECTVFTRKKERQNYIVYSCIFSVWTQIYSYIYSGRNLHSFVQNNHIHYWWTWKISWTFVCYSVSMQLYQYCHFTFTCRVSLHFYKSFVLSSFFLFFFFQVWDFCKDFFPVCICSMHTAGNERWKAGQNSDILLYIWKLILQTWGEILAQLKLMAKLQWGRISPLRTKLKYFHPYKLRTETCFQQDIISYYLASSKESFVVCPARCLKEIRMKKNKNHCKFHFTDLFKQRPIKSCM